MLSELAGHRVYDLSGRMLMHDWFRQICIKMAYNKIVVNLDFMAKRSPNHVHAAVGSVLHHPQIYSSHVPEGGARDLALHLGPVDGLRVAGVSALADEGLAGAALAVEGAALNVTLRKLIIVHKIVQCNSANIDLTLVRTACTVLRIWSCRSFR